MCTFLFALPLPVCNTCQGQTRAQHLIAQEFQEVRESPSVGAEIPTQLLCESSKLLSQIIHLCICWLYFCSQAKKELMLGSMQTTSLTLGSLKKGFRVKVLVARSFLLFFMYPMSSDRTEAHLQGSCCGSGKGCPFLSRIPEE